MPADLVWTRVPPTEADRRFAALLDAHVRKHRDAVAPLYALHRTHQITSEIEDLPDGGLRVTYTATPIPLPKEAT